MGWKKTFENNLYHISDKGLVSRIHKGHLKLNNKDTSNLIKQ